MLGGGIAGQGQLPTYITHQKATDFESAGLAVVGPKSQIYLLGDVGGGDRPGSNRK